MLLEHYLQLWIMFAPLFLGYIYLSARGGGKVMGVFIGLLLVIFGVTIWLEPLYYVSGYTEVTGVDSKTVTYDLSVTALDTVKMGDMSLRSILAIVTVAMGIYIMVESALAIMRTPLFSSGRR